MRHWTIFFLVCLCALSAWPSATAWGQVAPPSAPAPDVPAFIRLGADPDGKRDSTDAWDSACRAIPPGAQGRIELPPGEYLAASPWACDGRAVYVSGSGEGVTRIRAAHGGTVLSFTPGDLHRRVTIERLSVASVAPCMTDTGIAVRYPPSPSHLLRTLTIRDVEVVSDAAPAAGCHPSTIRRGLSLDGIWNGLVERVSINGPYALPPVAGTAGVEIGPTSVAVHLNELTVYNMEVAVDLAGYAEGIFLQSPTLVAVGIGFRAGRGGAARHPMTGDSALSLVFKDGECAVFHRCIDWTDVSTGQIYASRMAQQPNGPVADRFINLENSKLVLAHHNALFGDPRHVTIGLAMEGSRTTLNRLDGNQCLNLVRCVAFGQGTSDNTALGNQQNVATPNGFSDWGTGNVTVGIRGAAIP